MGKEEIDSQYLIRLVEARPVLWDRTCTSYKDRIETKMAWQEVCANINEDFVDYDDDQQTDYIREVVKRWVNIRDAYNKSRKKERTSRRSGCSLTAPKKYLYADHLKFLSKILDPLSEDSFSATSSTYEDSTEFILKDDGIEDELIRRTHCDEIKPRKRKADDVEIRMIKVSEQYEDRHISFFKGIVPTLHTLTEDEVVQFQMGVLQLITDIKQKRK